MNPLNTVPVDEAQIHAELDAIATGGELPQPEGELMPAVSNEAPPLNWKLLGEQLMNGFGMVANAWNVTPQEKRDWAESFAAFGQTWFPNLRMDDKWTAAGGLLIATVSLVGPRMVRTESGIRVLPLRIPPPKSAQASTDANGPQDDSAGPAAP